MSSVSARHFAFFAYVGDIRVELVTDALSVDTTAEQIETLDFLPKDLFQEVKSDDGHDDGAVILPCGDLTATEPACIDMTVTTDKDAMLGKLNGSWWRVEPDAANVSVQPLAGISPDDETTTLDTMIQP